MNIFNTGVSLVITKRLRMRSYHAGMVTDQHIAWLNDKDVVQFSEQRHKTHTIESQHSYLNALWKNPGSNIWMITVADGKIEIGTITSHLDVNNMVANMGIMIGEKDQWGKGYGLEAWTGIVNILRAAGVRKIEAGFMESNSPMESLLESAGFQHEADIRHHFVRDGKPESKVLFGLLP